MLIWMLKPVELGMRFGAPVAGVLVASNLSRQLDKLSKDVKKVSKNFSGVIGNVSFNYEEQELMRRVFKSIFKQLKNKNDRKVAKTILEKTGWIDGT